MQPMLIMAVPGTTIFSAWIWKMLASSASLMKHKEFSPDK